MTRPLHLDLFTRAALLAATSVLIPLQLDVFSLEGLDEFLVVVGQTESAHQKKPLRILGGVATMVDQRFKWGSRCWEQPKLEDRPRLLASGVSKERFWCGVLRTRGDYRKAEANHRSILAEASNSDAAKDIHELAKEVISRVSLQYLPISADSADVAKIDPMEEAIEAQVQSILAELEQLPPDIQLAIYMRLLNGLAKQANCGCRRQSHHSRQG